MSLGPARLRSSGPQRRDGPRAVHGLLAAAAALLLALPAADPAQARRAGRARTVPVDLVVIHSTGGPTCDAATGRPVWVAAGTMEDNLRTIEAHPALGIHYMIDRDGTLRGSVPEHQVAHHVFRHSERSIAIELINDGDGRDPFPPAQIDALVQLLAGLKARHPVQRQGVVRHSDLDHGRMPCDPAQRRKVDPGDAFPLQEVLDRVFPAPAPAAAQPAPRPAQPRNGS